MGFATAVGGADQVFCPDREHVFAMALRPNGEQLSLSLGGGDVKGRPEESARDQRRGRDARSDKTVASKNKVAPRVAVARSRFCFVLKK